MVEASFGHARTDRLEWRNRLDHGERLFRLVRAELFGIAGWVSPAPVHLDEKLGGERAVGVSNHLVRLGPLGRFLGRLARPGAQPLGAGDARLRHDASRVRGAARSYGATSGGNAP
eukprot:scaffold201823_cov37-Tisochrysis_lutea.AAC.2